MTPEEEQRAEALVSKIANDLRQALTNTSLDERATKAAAANAINAVMDSLVDEIRRLPGQTRIVCSGDGFGGHGWSEYLDLWLNVHRPRTPPTEATE